MSRDNSRRPGKRAATDGLTAASTVPLVAGCPSLQCPDCGAVAIASVMTHADTCPLNRGVDLVCDDDRDWFDANPGATVRRRPVTPAEVADMVAVGLARPVGTVTVLLLAPGLRSRCFEYEGGAR